ncbi:hypothetical protein [Candidatus Accumulibacter sp. ACC003]|uniref:hypothetical protein n=1 Tax=Candidatus Accumulibacter sp. ACC003 TaxID=2823334 RepID=UPI0025C07FDF|nr:hypothetical protein [Candidatus Accumulibacter sp. ACC003]
MEAWTATNDGWPLLLLWPIKLQVATTDRITNHNGRNPQERASLKKRLLRKWMSK